MSKACYPIFVHSDLDDYGLSPAEFRLYGHLSRRQGDQGAFASIASMAEVCRLHPQTIRKALRTLAQRHMIKIHSRLGETHLIHLRPKHDWHPPATPASSSPASPPKRIAHHPCETDAAKDTPIEINPLKERPSAASPSLNSLSSAKDTKRKTSNTRRDYPYPRKPRAPYNPARSFDPANYHQDISKL